jgi:hypothetical protein
MNRVITLSALSLYWLTIPTGVFLFLRSPRMGYPGLVAGVFAGILVLVPVVALLSFKKASTEGDIEPLPPVVGGYLLRKVAWARFAGFLLLMVGVPIFFSFQNGYKAAVTRAAGVRRCPLEPPDEDEFDQNEQSRVEAVSLPWQPVSEVSDQPNRMRGRSAERSTRPSRTSHYNCVIA